MKRLSWTDCVCHYLILSYCLNFNLYSHYSYLHLPELSDKSLLLSLLYVPLRPRRTSWCFIPSSKRFFFHPVQFHCVFLSSVTLSRGLLVSTFLDLLFHLVHDDLIMGFMFYFYKLRNHHIYLLTYLFIYSLCSV